MPKPRRHRNGNVTRARIGLVVVFVLLRLVDAFFVIALPGGPSGLPFAAVLLTGMWTTAVLIVLWRRQQWARIIMIALFGLAAIAALVMIPNTSNDTPFVTAYVVLAAVSVGCGAWLLYARDARRLTSRDRE